MDAALPESLHRAFAEIVPSEPSWIRTTPFVRLVHCTPSSTYLPLSATDLALLLSDLLIVSFSPACRRPSERTHPVSLSHSQHARSESLCPLPLCFSPDLMPCFTFTARRTHF